MPKAQSAGIEFEGTWAPTRDLLFSLSYSLDYSQILTQCTLNGAGQPTRRVLHGRHQRPERGRAGRAPRARTEPAGSALSEREGRRPAERAAQQGCGHRLLHLALRPGQPDPVRQLRLAGRHLRHRVPAQLRRRAVLGRLRPAGAWSGDHDRYEVIGYVRNVFNTRQYSNGVGGAGLLGNNAVHDPPRPASTRPTSTNWSPPRTFGVEVRYKFF